MPYENINIKQLIQNLEKGRDLLEYIMPLFMMHIWMKSYANKF
jgi:asparagine synthase (glutamine-hydrolysing)